MKSRRRRPSLIRRLLGLEEPAPPPYEPPADPAAAFEPVSYTHLDVYKRQGLVGEVIHTPARRARLVVGQALADVAPQDGRRFAVHLRATDDDPCGVVATGVASTDEAQLEIVTRHAGEAWTTKVDVRGATTVHGSVAIAGGALEIKDETPPPNFARPWQVYRVTRPADDDKGTIHEMRVELPARQEEEIAQLVIGAWSAEEKRFRPCLTVTNACTVIVHGKLIAADFLTRVEGAPDTDSDATAPAYLHSAGLTPEARSQLMGMLGSGIVGAKLRDIVPSRDTIPIITRQVAARRNAAAATPAHSTLESLETLTDVLARTSEEEMKSLLGRIFTDKPELAERVRAVRNLITDKLPRAPQAGGGGNN